MRQHLTQVSKINDLYQGLCDCGTAWTATKYISRCPVQADEDASPEKEVVQGEGRAPEIVIANITVGQAYECGRRQFLGPMEYYKSKYEKTLAELTALRNAETPESAWNRAIKAILSTLRLYEDNPEFGIYLETLPYTPPNPQTGQEK